jgi:hypothetical protein
MSGWIDQPQPGESWQEWLTTAECQRLLDNLPSRPVYDPEPGPSERECRADRIYHEAIQWAAANEPDANQRRILIHEARTSAEIAAFHRLKAAFDEAGLLNPGKGVPTLARCREYTQARAGTRSDGPRSA